MAHRSMVMVKRAYLQIAIVSLVTAVIWMFVSVYNSFTKVKETNVDASVKEPLNPTIKQEVLDNIINREDLTMLNFVEQPTANETVVPPVEDTQQPTVLEITTPQASESSVM